MSAHDFRIHAVGREVIVTCETCEDEIAASMGTIRLTEVERCVALHNGQTETPPEASKNGRKDTP